MKENYPPGRTVRGATTLDGTEGIHAVDPRYSQAQDLISKGNKSGAIAELLGLLVEKPGSAVAHNDLGCLYQEVGDPEAALRHYEKAIEIDPAYTTALK
ncbi:MAG TPA: tetratricopeptide repeat protein, partial [Syntrophales bacterium]|nr:tetratricopeptide repeat protein [Syntrophales bacterium]